MSNSYVGKLEHGLQDKKFEAFIPIKVGCIKRPGLQLNFSFRLIHALTVLLHRPPTNIGAGC